MNLDKVKTDGKKQTEEKKQVLKEEVLAEEITELQSIGLLNDVDANKKPSEVLNSIKEVQMDDVSYGEQNILQQKGKGRYRLDDKLLVILFLEAFQDDHNGKMTPKYELVSRWFGYPSNTIKKWWAGRVVHLRLSSELLRMTETLSKKDYSAMKDNDFVNLFNTLINKIRLMSNLSTNNVEHKHQGGVQLVMPQEN